MNYQQQVDAAIQAAAAKRFGSLPVCVTRQDVSERYQPDYGGVWFNLFIGGELVCRRRTRAELLAAIEKPNAYAAI